MKIAPISKVKFVVEQFESNLNYYAHFEPAMVALKYNPLMKVFAERLKADGLAPKAVIAACMHKLIRQIYGVLKSRTVFDATFLGNRLDFQDGI
ncbi:hypothetical protein [Hydrogenophaga sp. PAMC20947]|uniref:hypothetical protein n=1 Tax=Hydrogenophaga sp. PAMC20947 TaxID=2565558 RepID=UPI001B3499F5|nr:hypothetical protein [Hydrogenophaga sp. PAMC20947]